MPDFLVSGQGKGAAPSKDEAAAGVPRLRRQSSIEELVETAVEVGVRLSSGMKARGEYHLEPLDAVRAFYSVAVVVYHCTAISWIGLHSNGTMHDPSYADLVQHPVTIMPLSHGIHAPDVFFLLSGFLTTLSILQERSRSAGEASTRKAIASRALRLFPLIAIPLGYGILRDPFLWSSPWAMAGWPLMVGNLAGAFSTAALGRWWKNLSLLPCWSILVDMQITALLLVIVPVCQRRWPLRAWPVWPLRNSSVRYPSGRQPYRAAASSRSSCIRPRSIHTPSPTPTPLLPSSPLSLARSRLR